MQSDLISYYRDRAKEYEQIYSKPERQSDIEDLSMLFQKAFYKKEVLEIACGTGFWTERISKTASKILATDINRSVIDIARSKNYASEIAFLVEDLYNLPADTFECLFGGFIWSHIKLGELESFLNSVNKHIQEDGTIIFVDNNYVEGSNHPIAETDSEGNTYQIRQLANGERHKILKNFPTEDFVRTALKATAHDIEFINLKYYWVVKCQLRK